MRYRFKWENPDGGTADCVRPSDKFIEYTITFDPEDGGKNEIVEQKIFDASKIPSEGIIVVVDPDTYKDGKDGRYTVSYTEIPFKVEVVELAPKLQDEDGKEIAGSENPKALGSGETNSMVEAYGGDDYKDRIAFRELKIKASGLGDVIDGKKITWSMEAYGVNEGDAVRGDWAKSPSHKNRFEASKNYTGYGGKAIDQKTGASVFKKEGDDAFSAIRVNLPPIAWNKAKIFVEIEGINNSFEIITFEVPAVVVIDPGHGTGHFRNSKGDIVDSKENNAEGVPSETLEKDMTLDFSRLLRDSLTKAVKEEKLPILIKMTRDEDKNVRLQERAEVARDRGADVFFSIHFNDLDKEYRRKYPNSRGTEAWIVHEQRGNVNTVEDRELASKVSKAVSEVIRGGKDRGAKDTASGRPSRKAVLRDDYLGNYKSPYYAPCRATLLEVEFIDVPDVDAFFNTDSGHEENRKATMDAAAGVIIENIKTTSPK